MTTPSRAFGKRLREAREDLRLSQAALAAALGITQAAVSNWEAGLRQPSLDDLYAVAGVLGVEVLDLLPRLSHGGRVPVRAALRAAVAQLDQVELGEAVEAFVDAAEQLERPAITAATKAEIPQVAAEELLQQIPQNGIRVDVKAVAEACGVPVLAWPFEDALSALVVDTDEGPVIGINGHHHPHRRRFSVGHELGHIVLRHLDSFHVDLGVTALDGTPPNYNWRHERAANDFSASLLMPAGLIRRAYTKTPSVSRLATTFEVSEIAMSFRLKSLGLDKA